MNLDRLQTFMTVVQLGTFAAAADALTFTPSAVSQQMTKLEREAGTPLLRRGSSGPGRKVELTEAGRRLYAHALTISAAVLEARSDLASLDAPQPDRLRLGSFPAASAAIVPEALQRLRRRVPVLRPEVVECASGELRRSGVDLALCARIGPAGPVQDPAMTVLRIARAPLVAVLPSGHALAGHDEVPISALEGETLLGSPELPELASLLAARDAIGGRQRATAWGVTHPLSLLALAAAGEGIAVVPPILAGVAFSGVVLRPIAGGPDWELLALRPADRLSLTTAAFVDELRAVVAARPLLDAPVALAA